MSRIKQYQIPKNKDIMYEHQDKMSYRSFIIKQKVGLA